ncbi:MAG: 50S ribosomal protein L29 [Candidatus Fermentibacteraceae bacterium]|nr:50S ribosomal protein L29 [Candidatus Fermentibacteraceae bacterium]
MKIRDLRSMSFEELQEQVRDMRAEIFNLRFRMTANQLENPLKIRDSKRSLARALTVIREKELGLIIDEEGS